MTALGRGGANRLYVRRARRVHRAGMAGSTDSYHRTVCSSPGRNVRGERDVARCDRHGEDRSYFMGQGLSGEGRGWCRGGPRRLSRVLTLKTGAAGGCDRPGEKTGRECDPAEVGSQFAGR